MAIRRFERKIVAAIAAVAIMPLLGALVLGQRALREAYGVGVNQQVAGELERGLSLYQAHFATLRQTAERTADAVAADFQLNRALDPSTVKQVDPTAVARALDALLARYDNIVRIEVIDGSVRRAAREQASAQVANASDLRLLELERKLRVGERIEARVTVGTDARAFGDYQRAGEVSEVFRALEVGSEYVSGFYLAVYIVFLVSVIVVALGIGLALARRVTRRVLQLAEATQRVGAGDLSVVVEVVDNDEVGDLTRAFNGMVRDMRESRDRIEYLSRIGAWQEFARRLAHEIKNPLTPIQLAVQELHRSYKGDDARFRNTLEISRSIVEEEIATLRRLVSEFSDFARLPEAHLSPADLGVFVRDAVEAPFRADDHSEVASTPVELVAEIEPGALPVLIDSMLLKRCLDNLIRNAVQAVRGAGNSEGRVIVAAYATQDRVIVQVRDNGPGVPASGRDRVFDPYYTTKAEGTGLGLAIVKKIVLEHGGEISCKQAAEGGACFEISLPFMRTSRLPGVPR
ncbi:MAG: Nitrogen regulation protein NtrY [Myxococcaceae bacterium]|nr:Nitrogen regulation protein NtrY [Myxococcaceae bacterium]